jgi:hypothetical protein
MNMTNCYGQVKRAAEGLGDQGGTEIPVAVEHPEQVAWFGAALRGGVLVDHARRLVHYDAVVFGGGAAGDEATEDVLAHALDRPPEGVTPAPSPGAYRT